MKRGAAYCTVFAVALWAFVGSVCAAPVSTERLNALEQQVQAHHKQQKKLQAESQRLKADLTGLNTKLVKAAKKLQEEEAAATKAEDKLQALEADLKVAEDRFMTENQKLSEVLGAIQNLALHPTHSMLVMPLTPVDVVRSAVLMRDSVPYLNENAEQIKRDLEVLTKKRKEVTAQIQKLNRQKESLTKQQKELKTLVAQKTALRQKIEGESLKNKEEAAKLAAQASDLRDLLEKAEKEQERRRRKQEALRRAAREREEAARRRAESSASSARQWTKASDEERPSSVVSNGKNVNFASAYGKLVKPAAGTIVTAYGEELSKGVTSKGLVLKTRAGAQVVAPYDGTVIFSGPFKGYGNLIIMEHGQGYVSLLAGMNAVDTENGQMVLAGEPVGVMPDQAAAKLYIEIRKNQHPVNPAPWFGR
jgi:septal ring factor EnvC (AmiA/AmiB activator)